MLIIANPLIPVPPKGYGGAERIAYLLAKGLHETGHAVKLMAGPGSTGDWPIIVHRAPDNGRFASRAFRKILFQVTSTAHAFRADVVFCFSRPDYLWALFKARKPTIVRFGNPLALRDFDAIPPENPFVRLISVSDHQRRAIPRGDWITIPNGVRIETFPFAAGRGSYLAFLGRFHPNKGAHSAIKVALATGLPLKLAGNIPDDSACRAYFEREVKPHLGAGIEWLGEVDHAGKVGLLTNARALLFPIEWDEPFANVLVEALACGTPVIALRRGCVPEALEDGVTGFICDDVDQMIDGVGRLESIDRARCRAECEARFSDRLLVERYLNVARNLVGGSRSAAASGRSAGADA